MSMKKEMIKTKSCKLLLDAFQFVAISWSNIATEYKIELEIFVCFFLNVKLRSFYMHVNHKYPE
jgi:hypothetical protein